MGSIEISVRSCCAIAAFVTATGGCFPALAQCEPIWMSANGIAGVNGTVYASVMWDPDGAGPSQEQLVVGGTFSIAGMTAASNIATWDGVNWKSLGSGIEGPTVSTSVRSLAIASDGSLVVGGSFPTAGGIAANNIAKWNGTQWLPLGDGTTGSVFSLVAEPGGGVIAGGSFMNAGGLAANRIARWNGTTWSALGSGTNNNVYSLARLSTGTIVAGGMFTIAGDIPVSRIATWDGVAWSALGSGFTNSYSGLPSVDSIAIDAADRIVVAGNFFWSADGRAMNGMAQWTGAEWIDVGNKPSGAETCVAILANGDIVRSGGFKFDGTQWTLLGSTAIPTVKTITVATNGTIFLGGGFIRSDSVLASRVAQFTASKWQSVGSGWVGKGLATTVDSQGRLLLAGELAPPDVSNATNPVYQWDGADWEQIGTGFHRTSKVLALAADPNGGIYASVSGPPTGRSVEYWNGTSWTTIGRANLGEINSLLLLPNGDLIAAGLFGTMNGVPALSIARWNGAEWSPLGGGLSGTVKALAVLPNGDLIAGTRNGAHNASAWNGENWVPLISSDNVLCEYVDALAVLSTGELVGAGRWSNLSSFEASVAKWTGTKWVPYGDRNLQLVDGHIRSLSLLGNGSLMAGGGFRIQPTIDPMTWDLACQLPPANNANRNYVGSLGVYSLSLLPAGQIAAAGNFSDLDPSIASAGFTVWTGAAKPWIAAKPLSRTIEKGATLEISATPARGYDQVGYRWMRNGTAIEDGPSGASVGGGFVSGAFGDVESPTNGYPRVLRIENAQVSDTGSYEIVLENDCGSAGFTSTQVVRGCSADLSGDGLVDDRDFEAFAVAYDLLLCTASQMPLGCPSDLNSDGVVDDLDFVSFGQAYHAMTCP